MFENLMPTTLEEGVVGYSTKMILTGQAGVGKTSLTVGLNVNGYKALLLDLQSGSKTVSGYKIDLQKVSKEIEKPKYVVLGQVIKQVREMNKKVGGHYYDFLVIDPLTDLQDVITEHATRNFNESVMGVGYNAKEAENKFGKSYTKEQLASVTCKDVKEIGQNGWGFIQRSFKTIMPELYSLCPVTIILAHTKYKTLRKSELSPEINIKEMDFWPTLATALVRDFDDAGILNRRDDKLYVTFEIMEGQDHFKSHNYRNKEILLSELIDDKVVTYMERLFPFLSEPKPKS